MKASDYSLSPFYLISYQYFSYFLQNASMNKDNHHKPNNLLNVFFFSSGGLSAGGWTTGGFTLGGGFLIGSTTGGATGGCWPEVVPKKLAKSFWLRVGCCFGLGSKTLRFGSGLTSGFISAGFESVFPKKFVKSGCLLEGGWTGEGFVTGTFGAGFWIGEGETTLIGLLTGAGGFIGGVTGFDTFGGSTGLGWVLGCYFGGYGFF